MIQTGKFLIISYFIALLILFTQPFDLKKMTSLIEVILNELITGHDRI